MKPVDPHNLLSAREQEASIGESSEVKQTLSILVLLSTGEPRSSWTTTQKSQSCYIHSSCLTLASVCVDSILDLVAANLALVG